MTPTRTQIGDSIARAGQAARQVPRRRAYTPRRAIACQGIIGAGTRGIGIAMNFATAGIPVRIVRTTRAKRVTRRDGRLAIAELADCDPAILTGPGDTALSARKDLKQTHQGGAIRLPESIGR